MPVRFLLPLLVLGVPVADVVLDVVAFRTFEPLWVAGYLLAAFVVGVLVLRYAGPITLVRATRRLSKGEMPGKELVDGLLMLVGGLWFLFPGPVSDVLAIVCVTPFLRRVPRAMFSRAFRRGAPAEAGPLDVQDYRIE